MSTRLAAALSALKKKNGIFNLETFLFKEQLDFVKDEARFATACCSVRAGKTTACAADLMSTAINNPGTTGCYITLARTSAERIVWPELKKINREYGLGASFNEVKLAVTFPNESVIYLFGANDEAEIEKIRGLSNVILVYLDESQAMREHIQSLVEDIVVKRLYDTNGRCRMIGTPGPILAGYFYDSCHNDKWNHHHWSMHNNPWLFKKSGKTPDELIAQDCERRGVTVDDPAIQRECFGRWKLDPNSLLLNYNPDVNHFDHLPSQYGEWTYILGVDLGVRDSDSLSLLAFSNISPITYLVEEIITPNQLTDDLAIQINKLMNQYKIMAMPTDAGGLGLKIVEDLKSRYGIPLVPADKREKMANYRHLDNALRNGNFRAKRTSRFAQDCNILERDNDKSTPDRIVVKGHSDAVDSCLYAFKLSPAYAYIPPIAKPKPGTPEFLKEQEELHIKSMIEQVKREQNLQKSVGEYGSWVKNKKGISNWNDW